MTLSDSSSFLKKSKDGFHLYIKAVPGSKKTQISGVLGNRLKIKIQAPPEDGKANKELVTFLSNQLNLSQKNIQIITGSTSALKTILILTKSSIEELYSLLVK